MPGSEPSIAPRLHAMPDDIHPPTDSRPANDSVIAIVVAVAFVALTARFSVPVPGSPVPQSLQTLGVVLVGAALGRRRAGVALIVYLIAGALGLPVYADGAAGVAHLTGPTAGYLAGFVAGAILVGFWADSRGTSTRGGHGSLGPSVQPFRACFGAFVAMCAAHVVILGLGWLRLAASIGAGPAFTGGVMPFLWGGVAKSALGAVLWLALAATFGRYASRRANGTP